MAEGESSTKSGKLTHPMEGRRRLANEPQNMTDDEKRRGATVDTACSPVQDWCRDGPGNRNEANE